MQRHGTKKGDLFSLGSVKDLYHLSSVCMRACVCVCKGTGHG